jgi:hypothetical protein
MACAQALRGSAVQRYRDVQALPRGSVMGKMVISSRGDSDGTMVIRVYIVCEQKYGVDAMCWMECILVNLGGG